MDKDKTIKLIKTVKEALPLITAAASVFSIVIVQIFKGGTYLLERGYYDFWNIPSVYIEVNPGSKLFQFFLILSLTLIVLCFVFVYDYFFLKIRDSKPKKNKILVFMVLLVPVLAALIYLGCLFYLVGIKQVIHLWVQTPIFMLVQTITVVIAVSLCIFGIALMCYPFFAGSGNHVEKKNNEEQKKTPSNPVSQVSSNKTIIIAGSIFLTVLIIMLYWCTFTIYQQGKADAGREKTIDIVTMSDKTYVVLKQYGDRWILKECLLSDEGLKINRDTYVFADIAEKEILRYTLKTSQDISEGFLENDAFRKLKN